jgi:hypothetical protein
VVAREPDGLKILWRGTDSARVEERLVSGKVEELEEVVPGKHSSSTEIDAKGSKDAKRAGERLRDEFFKMMRARTTAQATGVRP